MENFYVKALSVGGVITVVLATMWSLYGKAIDKVSPLGAEASLIILGMVLVFVFITGGNIIENKHKETMKMQEHKEEFERKKVEQKKQFAETDNDNSGITQVIKEGGGEQKAETHGKDSAINQTM